MNPELEQLRLALNPTVKMNIVEQCRIVAQALTPEGDYPRQTHKLAQYLGVSQNKTYKMMKIHQDTIGQLKDWLKGTDYMVDMSYKLSTLDPVDQLKFCNLNEADKKAFLLKFGKVFQPEQEEEIAPQPEPLSPPADVKV